jgi:hypothetical protein
MTDVQPKIDLNMKGRSETQVESPSAYSNATRGNMEPVNVSDDDYMWYLNTERDIFAYIVTYIFQSDVLTIRYLHEFIYHNYQDFCQIEIESESGSVVFQLLSDMIKYKILNSSISSIDELYRYSVAAVYMSMIGKCRPNIQFHTLGVRKLISFIDTSRNTTSEFDFDRHQAVYQIIYEHMKYIQTQKQIQNEIENKKNMEKRQLNAASSPKKTDPPPRKTCNIS